MQDGGCWAESAASWWPGQSLLHDILGCRDPNASCGEGFFPSETGAGTHLVIIDQTTEQIICNIYIYIYIYIHTHGYSDRRKDNNFT